MTMKIRLMALCGAAILCVVSVEAREKKGNKPQKSNVETTGEGPAVLWRDPGDIASRDLFYGPGGQQDLPHGRFTFVEEDLDGSNPKFVVRDEDGVKWKAKLGTEARPETVASRLVWAVGYFANEDYFVPELKVDNLPAHLQRGREYVSAGGIVRDARLKRYLKDEKKIGEWAWDENPFSGTRELNGLRTLMGLMNNWDLKDENNSVYQKQTPEGPERIYMTTDLGASFGEGRVTWPLRKSKGDLAEYEHSKFITEEKDGDIDLGSPARPWLPFWFYRSEYTMRSGLLHIGRDIPEQDALWLGHLMSQLSHTQICSAFRAAGYAPDEVEGFAGVVEERIAELNALSTGPAHKAARRGGD
jgi:hypothetical protein